MNSPHPQPTKTLIHHRYEFRPGANEFVIPLPDSFICRHFYFGLVHPEMLFTIEDGDTTTRHRYFVLVTDRQKCRRAEYLLHLGTVFAKRVDGCFSLYEYTGPVLQQAG